MRTVGPVPSVLSLQGFKEALSIHPDDTERDAALAAYIGAAQDVIERACRRPMGPRPVQFTIAAGGWRRWWFPVTPVTSVSRVGWRDGETGVLTDLAPGTWRIARAFDEPQLVLTEAAVAALPDDVTFEVDAIVGLPVGEIPRNMITAMVILAHEWMDAGIAIGTEAMAPMSFGPRRMIEQMRYMRPQQWV